MKKNINIKTESKNILNDKRNFNKIEEKNEIPEVDGKSVDDGSNIIEDLSPYENSEQVRIEDNNNTNKNTKRTNGLSSKTLGITILILIFAVISVGLYSPLKSIILKESDADRYIGSYDFAFLISDLIKHIDRTEFQNKHSYTDRYNDMINIKYFIKNTDTDKHVTNIPDFGYYTLEKEISDSRFYMNMHIDKEGNPTISHLKAVNFNRSSFWDSLKNDYMNERNLTDESAYPGEMDIQIIVPEKISSKSDVFTRNMKSYYLQWNIMLIITIGGIGILILIITAFAIPYSTQKKAGIVNLFNNMYLELKILLWFCILMLNFGVINITSHNAPRFFHFDLTEIIYDANAYFYLIGIPVAFTLYYMIYLNVCYIKYIYYNGFVDGFIKNTMIGKLFFHSAQKVKGFVESIIDAAETKEQIKKLSVLLGGNLLILIVMPAIYPFGWMVAVGYTIFLFNYLMKVLKKIRLLNKASSDLSQGNFEIMLPEDMGILSPFALNLNNIKDGFKIAIEKEIKSQDMKTELITNVSHDLKTPLTSIITYVDLLKNEDLSVEKRTEYIDVIDKKSKRLKTLIDDLFDISRASSGNIELSLESLDVVALLRQTLGELEERIIKSSLQFKINLPESKITCQLDGRKTYRVFENIISNILKYSLENSRVYIDAEEKENDISFIFRNISSYEMNFNSTDITERFIRGDESRNTDGSGLGLAISKSLIELQKGTLDIIVDGDLFKLIATFPKSL
ncbi:MAG: HAMP domain-containing histidine kinase [Clostridiales bacterium]|nr:HAMP domain-containing histidine kinase [Clostridiales bacterium]